MTPADQFGTAEHHQAVKGETAFLAGVANAARISLAGERQIAVAVYAMLQRLTPIETEAPNQAGMNPYVPPKG
jgi:hypothetical protein